MSELSVKLHCYLSLSCSLSRKRCHPASSLVYSGRDTGKYRCGCISHPATPSHIGCPQRNRNRPDSLLQWQKDGFVLDEWHKSYKLTGPTEGGDRDMIGQTLALAQLAEHARLAIRVLGAQITDPSAAYIKTSIHRLQCSTSLPGKQTR